MNTPKIMLIPDYIEEIERLRKENQELKKQLEDKTEDYRRMKDNFDSKVDVLTEIDTQQKEFIKYLKDEIKQEENKNTIELLSDPNSCRTPNLRYKENILKEILQKYKEIIGVKDEKK